MSDVKEFHFGSVQQAAKRGWPRTTICLLSYTDFMDFKCSINTQCGMFLNTQKLYIKAISAISTLTPTYYVRFWI